MDVYAINFKTVHFGCGVALAVASSSVEAFQQLKAMGRFRATPEEYQLVAATPISCGTIDYATLVYEDVAGVKVIVGPQGPQGPVGPQGPPGAPGTNNYNELINRPSINGVVLSGDLSTEELGIIIPKYLSDLLEDEGHLTVTSTEKNKIASAIQNIIVNGVPATKTGDTVSFNVLTQDDVNTAVAAETTRATNAETSLGSRITVLNETKQNKLVSGVNIRTVNSMSLLGSGNIVIPGVEEAPVDGKRYVRKDRTWDELIFPKHPYISLERLRHYLYRVTFDNLPEDNGGESPVASGCSSYVKDGKLYTNLDWDYDNTASFWMRTRDFEGESFVGGLIDGGMDNGLIAQLPYRVHRGRNNHDIKLAAHILYNDWSWTGCGQRSINLTRLPFLVLSKVRSMETLESDLEGALDNLYCPDGLASLGYLLQVIVTDGTTTYALIPPTSEGESYEVMDITDCPKLANFRPVGRATVERTDSDIQAHPTGIERYNMMPCSLEDLRFTKAYEAPTRLSEFIGLRGTDKDSTDAQLEAIYNDARAIYLDRERDGQTWQTMESAIYSSKGLEALWIQENWDDNIISGDVTKEYVDGEIARVEGEIPTKLTDLVNDGNFVQDEDYIHTDNNYTDGEKGKLEGIEEGAEKNAPNTVIDANYVHTDNNYTTPEKNKLAGLENYDDTALKARVSTIEGKEDAWDAKADLDDIPAVIDNVTSTATDDALSAKQGKLLNDRIDNLSSRGRFLSLWDCTTGLPLTNPSGYPYEYKTGDFFIISKVGETNYIPNGSTYTGQPSTTVYTDPIKPNDTVFYDGTEWMVADAPEGGKVQDVYQNGTSVLSDGIAYVLVPTDLKDLTGDATHRVVTDTQIAAWNAKQDAISDLATIRSNAQAGAGAATTIAGYGNIVTHNTSEFATSSQGSKADSAIQGVQRNGVDLTPDAQKKVNVLVPTKTSDLVNDSNFVADANYVHTDNNYSDVEKGKVASALQAVPDTYRLAADQDTIDNAIKGRLTTIEGKESGWDAKLSDAPSDNKQYARKNGAWDVVQAGGNVDDVKLNGVSVVDENKVAQLEAEEVESVTIGDIISHDASEFATAAQGAKADSAIQPNDDISSLNNDAGYLTIETLPIYDGEVE